MHFPDIENEIPIMLNAEYTFQSGFTATTDLYLNITHCITTNFTVTFSHSEASQSVNFAGVLISDKPDSVT